MLPQNEARTLAEIEQHLRASDPELVRRFEPAPEEEKAPPRSGRVVRFVGTAGLVLGVFLLTLGFAGENADLALMGAAVLVMDAAWWVTSALVSMVRALFRSDDRHGHF
jgi:Protein of unknown function (DUF3040)